MVSQIEISSLDRRSTFLASLDDQLRLSPIATRGTLNLEALLHERLLIPDSWIHSNTGLAAAFIDSDYAYCTTGIVAPVLRRSTAVGNEIRKVDTLDDVHSAFLDLGMYDGHTTGDPEAVLLSQGRSDARGYHSRVSTEFCKRGAYVVRNPSIRNEYETLVRSVPNIEGRLATPKLPRGQWVRTIRSIEKSHGGSIPGRKQIYNAVDSKGFATSLKRAADFLYYTNLFQSLQMRPVFSYPARVSRFARAWIGSPLFGTPDYQSPLSSSVVRAQFSWEDLASLTVDDLVYLRKHVCKSLWKQIDSPNPASMEESAREVIESVRATIKHHRLSRHFNMNVAILATALAGGAGSLVLSLNSAAVGVYTLQLGTGVSLAGLGASILGELGHRGRLTALINAVRGLGLSSLTTHKGPTY